MPRKRAGVVVSCASGFVHQLRAGAEVHVESHLMGDRAEARTVAAEDGCAVVTGDSTRVVWVDSAAR
ncbi:hypothetical protein SUDANB171_01827 [Streptomyces sp. enrichment culture]